LPFETSAYPVDHSILGATAYILRGETTVAYTGDFRLHGKNGDLTREFVKQAKDASILIIEGTRAGPSHGEKPTEQSVCETCKGAVENSSGLIIADFSPRNFERLETFQEIAKKTNRDLVVTAKDAYMLCSLGCVDGVCRTESLKIYDEIKGKTRKKWESEVVQPSCSGQYVDHMSIRKIPGNYILCFSFFDMKHLLDIKPNGGTYIYSSCEAFNEKMEIDFRRLWHWLRRFNISPCGFSMEKGVSGEYDLDFDGRFHASGHASGEDITWVIDQVDPEYIIPIHTEAKDWFNSFESVVLVDEGTPYKF
jgi:ribonuclease J